MRSLVCAAALVLGLTACDTGQAKVEVEPYVPPEKREIKKPEMSPEELKAARAAAGHKGQSEIDKEAIAGMAKGEREYVKTRLAEHRKMLKTIRDLLTTAEKKASKWAKAKDPQKAFDKFSEKYKEDAKAVGEVHKKLLEGGMQIDVQAKFVSMFRSFENFNGDLGPEISAEEGFGKALEAIRAQLDEIDKELEVIEKDETLKVNENYKPEEG